VVVVLAGLALLGPPTDALAGPVKPTVSFTAAPTALTSSGGTVTLSAQVTDATSCLFTSDKAGIIGLPAQVACSNGTVTVVVSVPANSGTKSVAYGLHLAVTGATTVRAHSISLPVAGAPVVTAAPTDVQVTPAFGALGVTWTPEPPTVSYEVDGYIATATGRGLIVPQTCMGPTSCFIGGLTNGKQYSVFVQAVIALRSDPYGQITGYGREGKASKKAKGKPSAAQDCSYLGQYASLHGCDLDHIVLSGVDLTGSDLSDADLTGADLTSATLQGADLQGANLSGANLGNAVAAAARFQGAIMTTAVLSGANLNYANFTGVDLSGVGLSGVSLGNATLAGANLTGANLSTASLFTTDLTGTILSGADLTSAVLGSENLTGDDLAGANLTKALLGSDNLTDANLTGADLTDGFVNGDDLTGATLSGATLTGTIWNATTCPDGTGSSTYSPQTCANDLG
jgi:uncharacterized protein YjbI with pentapeptide repeats